MTKLNHEDERKILLPGTLKLKNLSLRHQELNGLQGVEHPEILSNQINAYLNILKELPKINQGYENPKGCQYKLLNILKHLKAK